MTTLRASSRWIVVVVSLVVIALPVSGAADDLNELLDADYAFSFSRVCVQTTVADEVFGASPSFQVPTGGATTRTYISKGVFSYNGDGTGSVTGTTLLINHDLATAGGFPTLQASFTADLTFIVTPDGSFTQELENFSYTILAGPSVGGTGTIVGIQHEGQIGHGQWTLVFKDTNTNLETVTFVPSGNGTVFTFERICGWSGMGVKIEEVDDD